MEFPSSLPFSTVDLFYDSSDLSDDSPGLFDESLALFDDSPDLFDMFDDVLGSSSQIPSSAKRSQPESKRLELRNRNKIHQPTTIFCECVSLRLPDPVDYTTRSPSSSPLLPHISAIHTFTTYPEIKRSLSRQPDGRKVSIYPALTDAERLRYLTC
jgi:hypothetical protein